MTIGLKLKNITNEIGGQDFFHSFFSTINYRLEKNDWGDRFPCLMKELYYGKLEQKYAHKALEELAVISSEFRLLSPGEMIWDIENLESLPPWGKNISDEITDLSNYFVTSTGRNLISVIQECIDELDKKGGALEIVSF